MIIWSAEIKELETLSATIRGKFPELEKELERLFKADDENMVLLYSRRCLEVIVTDLCECELNRPRKTEPLKGVIDKLSHEKKVPSNIVASMEGLNTLSTFGTHPKDFDPEQVKPVLNNLKTILKWYLKYKSEKSEAEERYRVQGVENLESRPAELKEATKKSKRRVIFLLSGILLVASIVVVALSVFNIIGGKKETRVTEKSIAVLPFKLLSDEPDKQYLADGMMDAILLDLSKVGDLTVRSRTSTEQYRNSVKTIPEIGKELGVEYLLEGSFQKSEDNVRLIVQLIDSRTDGHIWSSEYDRKWSDIFSVQSEVAQAVVKELKINIRPEEINNIEKIHTDNLQAYDYYLLGDYFRILRTKENLLRAKDYFEQAIEADPDFIMAYIRLAKVYGLLAFYAPFSPAEAYSSAFELATKALELDSLVAEAYVIKGIVDCCYNFDFIGAEKNYKKALELDPKNLEAYAAMSELLCYKGKFSEALEVDNRAMEVDPLYPVRDGLYGVHLYFAGYKDSALVHLRRLTERYPVCNFYLGLIHLREGEYMNSIERLERTLSEFSPIIITELGLAHSKSNALNETQRLLDTLERRAETEFVPYSMRGSLLSELGRNKEAMEYLVKGYRNKEEFILLLMNIDTISYSNLRSDSRFTEIIRKIKE
jgi:adenylate cyclase